MKLAALILWLPGACFALSAPSAFDVHRACVAEMTRFPPTCRAVWDKSNYPPGHDVVVAGVGRLPRDAYVEIKELSPSDPLSATDTRMCDFALSKMLAEPGGDHEQVARALWPVVDSVERTTGARSIVAAVAAALVFSSILAVGVFHRAARQ